MGRSNASKRDEAMLVRSKTPDWHACSRFLPYGFVRLPVRLRAFHPISLMQPALRHCAMTTLPAAERNGRAGRAAAGRFRRAVTRQSGLGKPQAISPAVAVIPRRRPTCRDDSQPRRILAFVPRGHTWLREAETLGATMNDDPTPGPQIEGVVIPHDRAEQVATIVLEAARADFGLLRAEMTGIRNATLGIQAELALLANKADVLRAQSDLRARIERVEKRLLMGFGVLAGALTALVIVALRYLPAVGHS